MTPHPATIGRPITSALAQARVHAFDACEAPDAATRERALDLAEMWAAVSIAEESHRLRREVRGLSDMVLRVVRALESER